MSVDPQAAARHLRAREQEARAAASARAEELRALLPDAARVLRQAGATRVFLFGSLARGDFRIDSDVDFAVTGLPRAHYIDALTKISDLLGVADLVRLEDADESLRARVREEGIEL